MDRETVVLDDAARTRLGGTYAQGSLGITHYELQGLDSGPLVVMLHGASTGFWDFDLQVGALLKGGFRVLRYDAFGRGLSDRPAIAYTKSVYVSQLEQLLNALGIQSPVFLLGHSLGGATAMEFASGSPERVNALALVSPVVNTVNARMPYFVCNTPIFGDFLLRVGMIHVLHQRANEQWQNSSVDPSIYDALFERQASIRGFEHASCSMFQTDLVGDYRGAFKAVGQNRIPGLLVFGGKDNTIVREDVESLKTDMPSFRFRMYPNGGHCTHVEYKETFNRELVDFFKSQLPRE